MAVRPKRRSPPIAQLIGPFLMNSAPDWVHDRYVAEHPVEKKLYRTWHPAIDPVYWCHFGHEHGSDPSLVGYTPYFGYIADKNNQDERHEGFKGFAFKNGDTDWYFNVTSHLVFRCGSAPSCTPWWWPR